MAKTDGSIIIEADIETKKFEAKLQKLENEAEKTSNDIGKEMVKKNALEHQFDMAIKNTERYETELNQAKANLEDLKSRMQGIVSTPIKTPDIISEGYRTADKIDAEKRKILELQAILDKEDVKQEAISQKIQEQNSRINNKKLKLQEINSQLELEKAKQSELGKSSLNIDQITKGIGNSISGVIGKVARWGLAIFGIRSAYMGIRRAISIVSAENEGVANSFQQIRKVIAGALLPVVQTVINWIIKLMQYINIIWKFFTGKTLFNFADATKKSASELKKGASSSGKIAKNLKDAKKQLAGFDEMNVLQDQEDTSGGGGGGAGDTDFGNIFDKIKDLPVPKWLQWILDHAPEIIALLAGITAGLIALKLGFTPLQALGIGLIVAGLVYALQALMKYLKDPSLANFGKIITGIGIALLGLAIIIGSLPLAIAAAVVAIVGIIITYWDKIKAFLQGGIDWLVGKSDWVHKMFGDNFGKIYDSWVKALQFVLDAFDDLIKQFKKIFDGLIKIVKGIINGDWKMVWEGAKDILVGLLEGIIDIVVIVLKTSWTAIKNGLAAIGALFLELVGAIGNIFVDLWNDIKAGAKWLWDGIKSVASTIGNWVNSNIIKPVTNFFAGLWNGVKTGATNAWAGVKNTFKTVATWFKTNVIDKIVSKFKSLGTKVGSAIGGAFKGAVNAVLRTIEIVLNAPIRAINSMIRTINKLPGVNIGTLSTFNLPRLAKGGIINQPGRGVPLGTTAIGGESSPEGVIPLTDSQQMALLGEAIGRYITVNASITNTMNGRVISRELKKVQNEDNFAFNR